MLSKEFLIKRMSTLWKKIYTHGEISLIESTDEASGARVTGVGFNDAHRLHSELYIGTLLERSDAKRYTIAIAERFQQQAITALDVLQESDAKSSLAALAHFSVHRRF